MTVNKGSGFTFDGVYQVITKHIILDIQTNNLEHIDDQDIGDIYDLNDAPGPSRYAPDLSTLLRELLDNMGGCITKGTYQCACDSIYHKFAKIVLTKCCKHPVYVRSNQVNPCMYYALYQAYVYVNKKKR